MADIVIKKKLSLEFLGEDYKDSFLTFKSIPVSEYEELTKKIDTVDDDNQKATLVMVEILGSLFIDGLFEGQKVSAEDLKQFDGSTVLKCFELLTGQVTDEEGERVLDPKGENKSTNTSSTDTVTP